MRPARMVTVLGLVTQAQSDLLCVARQITELPKSDCYDGVIVPSSLMADLRAIVRDLDGRDEPSAGAAHE